MNSLCFYIIFFSSLIQMTSALEKSPKQGPYKTSWSTDGITFGTAVVVAISSSSVNSNIPALSLEQINVLDKNDINPIDRISAGNFSKNQSKASDLLVGGAILSPLLLMLHDDIRRDVITISAMYLETAIFATFTPSYGKGGVRRIRPYVYGNTASLADKQDFEARQSFFSGHATWAFSATVFFASVYIDYHPDYEYKYYLWGGAIGLASAVSVLRVTSGAHFVSDVVVGAAVGSTIGYIIPFIHRTTAKDFSLQPMIRPGFRGLMFSYSLK